MKITDVKTYMVEGLVSPWVLVQVLTDEGLVGVGDGTNYPGALVVEKAIQELNPQVVGENTFNIERLWRKMYQHLYFIGISGAAISALSAIEIALWDIVGKSLGTPIYNLLGGVCRERIRLYANLWTLERGLRPEDFAERALRAAEEGYTAVKFDPIDPSERTLNRSLTPQAEDNVEARVRAVREAVGEEVDIALDMAAAMDPETAIRMGRRLEQYRLLFYEEPVPPENVGAMAKVTSSVNVPVCTGERLFTRFGFRELMEIGAADIIMPDVVRTGGIMETKKIAAMAEVHYLPVAPHNPNSPISTLASAHVVANIPNFLILEFLAQDAPWRDEIITDPLRVEEGHLLLPTKPGLGTDLDLEAVKRHLYEG